MAPRHGADAFGDLLAWLTEHSERHRIELELGFGGLACP